ncbi:hypothetical protein HPP92_008221 [Vanilla planifolia]|uniref:Uncharacterized protein n=1 Tax=Vanilla planifolia TaxID=51239 RepID=A0A835RBV7_VANPL|nr:hypothetical protein HPP92_008221 [Vanilla planifolia]
MSFLQNLQLCSGISRCKDQGTKGMEQVEEQRVIEAQIRVRQQELQVEKEKLRKKEDASSSSRTMSLAEENQDLVVSHTQFKVMITFPLGFMQHTDKCTSFTLWPEQDNLSVKFTTMTSDWEGDFDLDLEDTMIMEAIWLSIQEQGLQGSASAHGLGNVPGHPLFSSEDGLIPNPPFPAEASLSRGLICAAASQLVPENMAGGLAALAGCYTPLPSILQCSSPNGNYPAANWTVDILENSRLHNGENGWMLMEHGPNAAEGGTGFANSNITSDTAVALEQLGGGSFMASGHLVPENFDDQVMLTMAVSMSEAGGRWTPTPWI